ncbi:MAG: L-aspartate oxidase [Anaerolineae bacterium]
MSDNCIESEVLIIGGGIAGGTAALQLAEAGSPVLLITRGRAPEESNTYYAQGGIIFRGADDSPDLLTEDLTRAGAGRNQPTAVQILANEGPDLVQKILVDKVGVPFERDEAGKLAVIREAAHSTKRILHAADVTGRAIEVALMRALQAHPNVTILTGHTAVDLLTPAHHSQDRLAVYDPVSCVGAYVLDQNTGQVKTCLARKTILATGGIGQIYLRTTNPEGARGDGVAMAYRAGARVINAEFVQFHPTTFHKRYAPPFLISEAVRGAGARLVNADGRPFMQEYAPEWKDLAPRDVVARSIHREMEKQGVPHVFLDLRSYIEPDVISSHFPGISEQCAQYGVDIQRDLAPVVPGAHYFCGGVWADEYGRTTIQNLYAIGEVSCTGVHGANRLGSASLLEGLVWGNRAAQDVKQSLARQPFPADDIPSWQNGDLGAPDPALIRQDMSTIQHIMWNYVGLVRNTWRLERAIRELRHLETEIERFYRRASLTDELIGLRNGVRTAVIVAQASVVDMMSENRL